MKRYRAYRGIFGWAMLMPGIIPYPILLFVVVKMLDRGMVASRVMIPYLFVGILIVPLLSRSLWIAVTRTVLTLDEGGITYTGKVNPWDFFKQHFNFNVPWSGVREVCWVEATNGPLVIKTDQGDIRFWVIFHDKINAEIMREILVRAPHLKMDGTT